MQKKLKIVSLADNHGQPFAHLVPECDILIHAGDILPDGGRYKQEKYLFGELIQEFSKVEAKHIVFVAGNHCYLLEDIMRSKIKDESWLRSQLPQNVHYLRDSGVVLDGVSIWGTPWVINLGRWAFSKESPNDEPARFADQSDDLRGIYSKIPDNVDFLISHGPAYGFCDQILEFDMDDHLGCKPLTEAILQKKPKYVISGHIHSANHNGEKIVHDLGSREKTELFCVSILDESYKVKYSPKVIEI